MLNLLSAYNLLERIGREHRHPADTETDSGRSRWSDGRQHSWTDRRGRRWCCGRSCRKSFRQNSQFCSKKWDNPQQARYQRLKEARTSGKTARYDTCARGTPLNVSGGVPPPRHQRIFSWNVSKFHKARGPIRPRLLLDTNTPANGEEGEHAHRTGCAAG